MNPNLDLIDVDLLPGDYNDDGAVDAADYVEWRNTLGQSVAILTTGADGDGDGTITAADYEVWRVHYGETLTVAGSGGAVPEPATWSIIQLAAMIILYRRRCVR